MNAPSQLKAIATGNQGPTTAVAERPNSLAALLASPKVRAQIANALPRHMTPERMTRIALTELRKTPKLQQTDPASFLGAVVQCAQLGLEPGSSLGHAYILPFDRRKKVGGQWQTVSVEAQVIIGYRGMIDLARRSGQIVSIDARAVYEGDEFACALGLESTLTHVPNWDDPDRTTKPLRFVYAVAKLKDGGVQFEVMARAEIDAIRARSKSKDDGPWATDFVPMALKTVIRRLFKYLPVSIELQTAIALDERSEAGISQDLGSFIDTEATTVSVSVPESSAPATFTVDAASPGMAGRVVVGKTAAAVPTTSIGELADAEFGTLGDRLDARREEIAAGFDSSPASGTARPDATA